MLEPQTRQKKTILIRFCERKFSVAIFSFHRRRNQRDNFADCFIVIEAVAIMSIHSLEATNDDRKLFENISPQTLSKLSIEQLIITQRGNYRQLSNAETFVGGFASSPYVWLPIRLIIQ